MNDEGPGAATAEAFNNQRSSNPTLARKRPLREPHPLPKGSGQDWKQRRKLLRAHDGFRSLALSRRYIIEYVYEKYGHGPKSGLDGLAWFVIDALAAELDVDRKTILGALDAAEAAGVLVIQRWFWAKGGRLPKDAVPGSNAPNSYRLTLNPQVELQSPEVGPYALQPHLIKELTSVQGSSQNPSPETKPNLQHSPTQTDFDFALKNLKTLPGSPFSGLGEGGYEARVAEPTEEQIAEQRFRDYLETLPADKHAEARRKRDKRVAADRELSYQLAADDDDDDYEAGR